jgi:hypothetical protein
LGTRVARAAAEFWDDVAEREANLSSGDEARSAA